MQFNNFNLFFVVVADVVHQRTGVGVLRKRSVGFCMHVDTHLPRHLPNAHPLLMRCVTESHGIQHKLNLNDKKEVSFAQENASHSKSDQSSQNMQFPALCAFFFPASLRSKARAHSRKFFKSGHSWLQIDPIDPMD